MHPTQKEILESLRQSRKRQFSALLNDVAETSDNLTYHLKQLQKIGYIESPQKGEYILAQKGLVYLNNNLELDNMIFPTVSCMLELCDQQDHILVMKKRKQPYLGSFHLLTFGVTSSQSIKHQIRSFLDTYQIDADYIQFKTVYRDRKLSDENAIIFDKFFIVFSGTFSSFEKQSNDREFLAITRSELIASSQTLFASKEIASLLQADTFQEKIHSEKIDQFSE